MYVKLSIRDSGTHMFGNRGKNLNQINYGVLVILNLNVLKFMDRKNRDILLETRIGMKNITKIQ